MRPDLEAVDIKLSSILNELSMMNVGDVKGKELTSKQIDNWYVVLENVRKSIRNFLD